MSEALGRRVAELRNRRKWSVAELARESKVVEATIYRTEAGTDPRYGTLRQLAKAFGITVSQLTRGVEPDEAEDDAETGNVEFAVEHQGITALLDDAQLCTYLGITDEEAEWLRDARSIGLSPVATRDDAIALWLWSRKRPVPPRVR
jgi:transcriptional regulator with XRE-family HTH domain